MINYEVDYNHYFQLHLHLVLHKCPYSSACTSLVPYSEANVPTNVPTTSDSLVNNVDAVVRMRRRRCETRYQEFDSLHAHSISSSSSSIGIVGGNSRCGKQPDSIAHTVADSLTTWRPSSNYVNNGPTRSPCDLMPSPSVTRAPRVLTG